MSPHSSECFVPKITQLRLHLLKLFREKYIGFFFAGHSVYVMNAWEIYYRTWVT